MTFEEWFKKHHNNYVDEDEIMEEYEDYPSNYKVEKLLKEAYEAGAKSERDRQKIAVVNE